MLYKITFMKNFIYLLAILLFFGCKDSSNIEADLFLFNGNFSTINSTQPSATALAITDGRITAIGGPELIEKYQNASKKSIDLNGQFAIPGFIEGHGHFSNLGKSLIHLNFLNAKNWQEIVRQVAEKAATLEPGVWIEGRAVSYTHLTLPTNREV